MNTIQFTDEELEVARQGMTAFLHNFSHDEVDTVRQIKAVLARLADPLPEQDEQPATVV